MSGRPGPVVLALPGGITLRTSSPERPGPRSSAPRRLACPDALQAMLKAARAMRRSPVAIIGGAGWNSNT